MPHPVDVTVRQSASIKDPDAPRNRNQALADELERGPVKLRVPIVYYRRHKRNYTTLERSWVIECRTPAAVAYVRRRLRELMKELDGTAVVEEGSGHGV